MAANATAHLHFVMAGTRRRGKMGVEREGRKIGGGWLVCTELPFSVIGAWLSPPIVKMLTAPSE